MSTGLCLINRTLDYEETRVETSQVTFKEINASTIAEYFKQVNPLDKAGGYAIQTRINMETLTADGSIRPSGGTLSAYEVPGGTGVRTDGFGYSGYETNPAFDSLLAKLIVHTPSTDFARVLSRTRRTLNEFRIEGVATSIPFLQNLLQHPDVASWKVHTRFVEENLTGLTQIDPTSQPRYFSTTQPPLNDNPDIRSAGLAGAQIDTSDPLALFSHDQTMKRAQSDSASEAETAAPDLAGPDGTIDQTITEGDDSTPDAYNLMPVTAGTHKVRIYSEDAFYGPGAYYRCTFWITDFDVE